jgi:K+-sensing histidine kinase KdpD
LNYEIFWDPSNQHEFLKTIDTSVDKVTRLVLLFTLTFRAEAGSLELKPEPQSLQEILAVVQANVASRSPRLLAKFSLPKEGKPVLVDYEYLTMAFGFLFELFDTGEKNRKIRVRAIENQQNWSLEIAGIDEAALDLIRTMHACKINSQIASEYSYLPEQILGINLACEILHLQGIELDIMKNSRGDSILHLIVPAFIYEP